MHTRVVSRIGFVAGVVVGVTALWVGIYAIVAHAFAH